ncbi:MAG: choice-of-anchor tandem repeat GloVer-containing protein [Candidatus Sulfotelmatobacter sp.]|jgi:hypothetical protein
MPHSTIARSTHRPLAIGIAATALLCLATVSASAQTETVLYSFQPTNDISSSYSSLVSDSVGNLYGTALSGGSGCAQSNCGGVFRLSPPTAPGGSWTETILYNFGSILNDGVAPRGALAVDQHGNLYGITSGGGTYGYGTVFELSPPANPTGAWTESILYNFKLGTADGSSPVGGVAIDANGNLFGTTTSGGPGYCYGYPGACGTAFELSPPPKKGAPWKRTIIHAFGSGSDGSYPWSAPVVGAGGVLYGTTAGGGIFSCGLDGEPQGCGVVYQLTPPASAGEKWTESIYRLPSELAGAMFLGGVVQGRKGFLYASIYAGGPGENCLDTTSFPIGCGGILELAPPAPGNSKWHVSTIYTFTGLTDGAFPLASLTIDSSGNLYGTTGSGGGLGNCTGAVFAYATGCGTVFKLTRPSSPGGPWTETTLHDFSGGSDGLQPWGTLLLSGGVLYGTTPWGGYNNGINGLGTVYSVVP